MKTFVETVIRLIVAKVVKRLPTMFGLQLGEAGDFVDENRLPSLNLTKSSNLHLTIAPPISEARY